MIFFLMLFISFQAMPSKYGKIKFKHLTMEDGLSQASVFCAIQCTKGFLWFGTEDGLNKYDGKTMKIYKPELNNPTSINNNYIIALYEDKHGYIWVGTNGGGLNRFDPKMETLKHFMTNPKDPYSISYNRVTAICEDHKGYLWIATRDGLNLFDRKSGEFTKFKHDAENPHSICGNTIRDLSVGENGNLWIATEECGLDMLIPRSRNVGQQVFYHFKHNPSDASSLHTNTARSVFKDRAGVLWIGTLSGLSQMSQSPNLLKPNEVSFSRVNGIDGGVNFIYEDTKGNLWIGTDGAGLYVLDLSRTQISRYRHASNIPGSLSHNRIYCAMEDRSGMMWIGTRGGALNYFNTNKKTCWQLYN